MDIWQRSIILIANFNPRRIFHNNSCADIDCLTPGRQYPHRFVCFIFLFAATIAAAQDKPPVKFGKVTIEDFNLSKRSFDTSVNAVVIADVGTSYFEGNVKGWFTLVHKRKKRVKILNQNGYEAANVEVLLYSEDNNEEKLEDLKASTYNLENGTVIETKLGNDAVYKEKVSKNVVRKKFTFPAAKEGSIIEFSYTLYSDFLFNLQPWSFQGEYPCLWSEYEVNIPEFFNYVFLAQGYQPYFINKSSSTINDFSVEDPGESMSHSRRLNITSGVAKTRWVMKEVPALKEESFTSTIKNHVAKIEFQLSQYRFPNMPVKPIMGNWLTANETLLKREEFGLPIEKDNSWLKDEVNKACGSATGKLEKAKKIFDFVRDHYTCTSHYGVYLQNSLKTIFKNKNGTVADINLLLVAMLRNEKIPADPMLLSTRENGYANEMYPLMERFNYVIAVAHIDGSEIYLDASRQLGFGKLAADCYNGMVRLIAPQPAAVYLDADSLKENKLTSVFIVNDEKGDVVGSLRAEPGYVESMDIRSQIREKGETGFFKNLEAKYSNDVVIEQHGIDSLAVLEQPVVIHYDFALKNMTEDLVYFNPMMDEGYRENQFKSADRKYPVEMPYVMNKTFILNMEVPKNYEIDEMPKSAKVELNGDEGFFEYLIGRTGEASIQLRSRIVLNKAYFPPEDYNSLREFFGHILKKHSEQIVFKKISKP